jgi:F420-dependent oxidoreductase-like protein
VLDKIKFGVFLPFYAFRTENRASQLFNRLHDVVLECERLRYDSVWLDDHMMLNDMPILECWTTLSALSRITEFIRLGTMVTCNSFRNPALLAKMAATLDNISDGRLELGIGAGVQKNEHNAYGFPFSFSKARVERMGEAVAIIKKMWTEQKVNYTGKYYRIIDAVCEPKPMQKPHPPIIVGGGGEKLTLKVTAQYADRYDWGYISSLMEYKRKLKVLEKHCKSVGRCFNDIEKSCWPAGQVFIGEDIDALVTQWIPKGAILEDFLQRSFVGTPEDCIKLLQPYANLGVTQYMLFFGDLPSMDGLRLFAEKVAQKMKRNQIA